jgi:uncharacterized protein YhdP
LGRLRRTGELHLRRASGKFAEGRGELFLGDGDAALPAAKGLRIRGVLSELDVGPWKELVDRYAGNDPGGSATVAQQCGFQGGQAHRIWHPIRSGSLQLERKPTAWACSQPASQRLANLPDAKGAPIAINLQYVRLPALDPTVQADENRRTRWPVDPTKIPALDITINQLFQGMIWSAPGRSRFDLPPRDRPQ